jgi:ankyrin repeat protein
LLLTKDGIDRDCKDTDNRTPLFWAAARGHDAIITLFLTKDSIDPNSRDRYGQTPLLLAAGNGHEAAVNLLLAEDAVDSGSKDNFGRTPLTWAAEKGHSNIIQLLREEYQTSGVLVDNEDLDIALCPTPNRESCIFCDICLSWIPNVNIHYHCGICSRGDFDLCQDCLAYGAFCINESHELTKRMVKGDDVVEVSN